MLSFSLFIKLYFVLGNLGTMKRQPSAKKRFQLKPSSLVVPKELDVEMNSTNSKVQKSTREFEEVQNLRRSSRKTRFLSKVTFSTSK